MLESNLPLQRLSISSIHEHGFLSKIDENIVTGLMDSIAVDGLNNPIAIWYQNHAEGVIPFLVAGRQRWLAKFEHWDKWNFCLNSAMMPWNRRDDDEAYPP
jgi:hypothetical protein